ncbi:MAG: HEPN domain-containing protein [Thermoplasmata archaeon]
MTETSKWWNHSRSDLETAEYNLKGEMLNAAAFYAQQAAEKALKALQIERLGRFDRTHDLLYLARSVDAPAEILRHCELIAPFYTVTRYPNAEVPFDKREVSSVVKASGEVMEWVGKSLK